MRTSIVATVFAAVALLALSVLAQTGADPARGAKLYETAGCLKCHKFGDRAPGQVVGPARPGLGWRRHGAALAYGSAAIANPGVGEEGERRDEGCRGTCAVCLGQ